ncbi:hypothetical protein BRADI_2g37835v3 [Brachypodium distachyon]|uniref:Uncharacterized protein n=1 Tax=Brachypodium distachyon TaxID=15368 RepID=A0A0Q3IPP4_BRADI|nr:hypothetical protein BRADI_2g37835v3 [Brachypodium distachyon]PNT71970.1 hypothetical protein BRADI_2g37835v3 [Brachypodium distachyon]
MLTTPSVNGVVWPAAACGRERPCLRKGKGVQPRIIFTQHRSPLVSVNEVMRPPFQACSLKGHSRLFSRCTLLLLSWHTLIKMSAFPSISIETEKCIHLFSDLLVMYMFIWHVRKPV